MGVADRAHPVAGGSGPIAQEPSTTGGPPATTTMSGRSGGRRPARARPAAGPRAGRCRAARRAARPGPGSRGRSPRRRGRRRWRSACCRVKSGRPWGSAISSGHGLAPNGDGGLAAASTNSSTASPPAARSVTSVLAVVGGEALDRPAVAEDAGPRRRSRCLRRSRWRSRGATCRPAHSAGMVPAEAEPGGVPGRAPGITHGEGRVLGGERLLGGDRLPVHVVGGHLEAIGAAPPGAAGRTR